MKQQILEEFDSAFNWAEKIKGQEIERWKIMYGFTPSDLRDFLSSSIDRVLEEARKCVPNEIEDTCGCRECSEAADLLRNQAAKTLQALDKLKV